MHPEEYQNWQKVKEHMEKIGKTDNYFYTRACAIVSGKPDPLDTDTNELSELE